MTRRDYVLIAEALKDCPHDGQLFNGWAMACEGLADALQEANARFERERFLTACGFFQSHHSGG